MINDSGYNYDLTDQDNKFDSTIQLNKTKRATNSYHSHTFLQVLFSQFVNNKTVILLASMYIRIKMTENIDDYEYRWHFYFKLTTL